MKLGDAQVRRIIAKDSDVMAPREFPDFAEGDVANVAVSGGGKVAVGDLNTFETSAQIAPPGQPDGMS